MLLGCITYSYTEWSLLSQPGGNLQSLYKPSKPAASQSNHLHTKEQISKRDQTLHLTLGKKKKGK